MLVIPVFSCVSSKDVVNSNLNMLELLIFSHICIMFPHLNHKLTEGKDPDLGLFPQCTSPGSSLHVETTQEIVDGEELKVAALKAFICHGG